MFSLYFNIQHKKDASARTIEHHGAGGIAATYGRELQLNSGNNVGLINGGIVDGATTGLEMGKVGAGGGGKRGSRKGGGSSSRRKKASSARGGGGGYARVNGDGGEDDGGVPGIGVYGVDSEEEVDLGLVRELPPVLFLCCFCLFVLGKARGGGGGGGGCVCACVCSCHAWP